jgi:triphosphoribosyl-dephospho-CoA synthase
MPSLGLLAQTACIWEATARKPGNVSPVSDFADLTYLDFLLSAAAIAPVFDKAAEGHVGETILEAIRATRHVVGTNTNLGIVLLLAPLAAASAGKDLKTGVAAVLANLDIEDARLVYEAIRLAQPGGLGSVGEQDVYAPPTQTLRDVMGLAAQRDGVARQYVCDFADVFDEGVPALRAAIDRTESLEAAIVYCYLELLARHPDTLMIRKRGMAEAEGTSRRARQVIDADWPTGADSQQKLADLDAWLRAEGNRRNPGTTADLVTACLFVALRTGILTVPPSLPWPMRAES